MVSKSFVSCALTFLVGLVFPWWSLFRSASESFKSTTILMLARYGQRSMDDNIPKASTCLAWTSEMSSRAPLHHLPARHHPFPRLQVPAPRSQSLPIATPQFLQLTSCFDDAGVFACESSSKWWAAPWYVLLHYLCSRFLMLGLYRLLSASLCDSDVVWIVVWTWVGEGEDCLSAFHVYLKLSL